MGQVSRVAHFTVCSHAAPHYPGGPPGDAAVDLLAGRLAFPVCASGRLPRLPFRGLLGLHSRCGLRTCSTSFRGLLSLGFESEGHPSSPPDSYRGGRLPPRAGLPPAGQVHLHGARTLGAHAAPQGKSAHGRERPEFPGLPGLTRTPWEADRSVCPGKVWQGRSGWRSAGGRTGGGSRRGRCCTRR